MILCLISRPGWWIACIDDRERIKAFVWQHAKDGDEVGRWKVPETKGSK